MPLPRILRGPRVCGDETEKMDWAGSCVVALDDGWLLGVRCSSPELLAVVERALASRLVSTQDLPAEDVPAYFSLLLGAPSRRTKHPLHYLYNGGAPVLATRDVGRLLEALMRRIGVLARSDDDRVGLLVQTTALVTPDGRAFLVPSDIQFVPKEVEKSLSSNGSFLADVSQVELDPAEPDLVLRRPDFDIDWSALDREQLADIAAPHPEPTLDFGRYRLAGWLLTVSPEEAVPVRPAAAIAEAARLVSSPFPGGPAQVLEALSHVVRTIPVTGMPNGRLDELVDQVIAAL